MASFTGPTLPSVQTFFTPRFFVTFEKITGDLVEEIVVVVTVVIVIVFR